MDARLSQRRLRMLGRNPRPRSGELGLPSDQAVMDRYVRFRDLGEPGNVVVQMARLHKGYTGGC